VPEGSTAAVKAKDDETRSAALTQGSSDYVLPFVHAHVPAAVVEGGFWGGLVGALAIGVVDPPLGMLVGAGVVIARHQSKR
jgi:uncharacterized membrane protein